MNLLRNPWITGALAIVAVAVVWYQLFPTRPSYPKAVEQPSSSATVATSVSSREQVPTLNLSTKPSASEPVIDREFIQSRIADWVAQPLLDPFQLFVPRTLQNTNSAPWVRWRLRAIWRQDGSSLCAINTGIYREGDMIDGYRIDKIEDGQVWLQGPKLRERLGFDKMEIEVESGLPVPTNSAPQHLSPTDPVPTNHQ